MSSFVHLSVHSDRSLIDSMIPVKKLVDAVSEKGMPAVALADHMNMFGTISFYQKCLDKGIKPITASEIRLKDGDNVGNMTLIATNNVGYRNLMEILSESYESGYESVKDTLPTVSREIIERHSEGLIALSGARFGLLGQGIMNRDRDSVVKELKWMRSTFGKENTFIELQRTGLEKDEEHLHMAAELAARNGYYVVATNPVRFLSHEDYRVHNIRGAINEKCTVDLYQKKKSDVYTPHMYLKSADEMAELFSDIPEAIENTVRIARRCSVEIELGKNYLPAFPVPEGQTEAEFLRIESEKGLQKRLEFEFGKDNPDLPEIRKEYDDRLKYELDVINNMGFPGYFLIVSDFIQWSKDNNIAVGPGRGSGAGSLVAYSLGITDLNPLKYDLLFERFLNPERVSMPDFDVDFCMDERDRVIGYVADKYGHKAVSQIVTYGTLGAKAVVRDVARALGYSPSLGNRISQFIPEMPPGIKLQDALNENPTFKLTYDEDPEVKEVVDIGLKLEGMARQTGKHAGGVLIAPGKLSDYTPTYNTPEGNGFVSQYDKNDVETAGLVKFDFLGLRTLTIIQNAINSINAKRKGEKPLDILGIRLDDQDVLRMFQQGETNAVFQVESPGMKKLLKQMKPDCFEDLIALVALYRPGPLDSGMVENFVDRKHGREEISYPDPTYQHPLLEPILKPTYGIILYQEQVMKIAQELAGYSLGEADLLRRAMGKKKPEEMAKQRSIFEEGAKKKGIDPNLAMKIFDLVEKFAGYGFNKSHSAAYALISYQTAWLKQHYPAEFMASVMSSDMNSTEKVVGFINEARRLGLKVNPPSINDSIKRFVAGEDGNIYYGLEAIKNVGASALKEIMEDREKNGPFTGVLDFLVRIGGKSTNINVMRGLIKSGAMDEFGFNRATLMHNIDLAKTYVKKKREKAKRKGESFDLFSEEEINEITDLEGFEYVDEYSPLEKLSMERQYLGLYISGHPLSSISEDIPNISESKISDLVSTGLGDNISTDADGASQKKAAEISPQGPVVTTIAGVVMDYLVKPLSKGKNLAVIKLDDGSGQIDVTIDDKTFNECQHMLNADAILQIEGVTSTHKKTGITKFKAKSVKDLNQVWETKFSGVSIDLNKVEMTSERQEKLNELMSSQPRGLCNVQVRTLIGGSVRQMPLGNSKIKLDQKFVNSLKNLFDDQSIELIERTPGEYSQSRESHQNEMKEEGRITSEERRQRRAELFTQLSAAMSM